MTTRKWCAGFRRSSGFALGLWAASLSAGCTGSIGDGTEDSVGIDAPSGGGSASNVADDEGSLPLSVGAYHLMRLTRAEYNNTIRDLLGDDSAPANGFAPDEKVGPFDANVLAPPSEGMVEDYMDAAEALAAKAVQDLPTLTGCNETDIGSDACAAAFIDRFGRRAYRRPLLTEEANGLLEVYSAGKELGGFAEGIELLVRAILQSPNFLYRVERGKPDTTVPEVSKLTGYEMASRLSYFILDSMPDDDLLDAAEDGTLDSREGVEAEARRLLASSKAAAMIGSFHTQWMSLGVALQKDAETFPTYTDALPASMRNEVALFSADVILNGDGKLSTLLTAPYTFADASLADIYGVEHNASDPDEFVRIDLDPETRGGIMTLTGPLAATSHSSLTSSVLRGRFIRTYVLCQTLPPPPVDIDTSNLGDPDLTPREQSELRRQNPSCAPCHDLMDPIGYGLDNYDAIGRYRTKIGDDPVDASGEILSSRDVDGEFEGGVELGQRLASSEQVAECVARQWFRFALGRTESTKLDAASLRDIDAAFADGDVRELIVALTLTDAFQFRATTSELDETGDGQ